MPRYTNKEVATLFANIGDLMEIKGENRFKILAYRKAADNISHLGQDLYGLWESGMDLPMGDDLYESFMNYQQKTIELLDVLATEYTFDTIDGTAAIEDISDYLCQRVSTILRSSSHGREARASAIRSHSP